MIVASPNLECLRVNNHGLQGTSMAITVGRRLFDASGTAFRHDRWNRRRQCCRTRRAPAGCGLHTTWTLHRDPCCAIPSSLWFYSACGRPGKLATLRTLATALASSAPVSVDSARRVPRCANSRPACRVGQPIVEHNAKPMPLAKTLIFTDNDDWSDAELVRGYRAQHHVESAFRQLKDTDCIAIRP